MKTYKIQIEGYSNGGLVIRDSLITLGKKEELYQLDYDFLYCSPEDLSNQPSAEKVFKNLNIDLKDYKYTAELYIDNYTHLVIDAFKYKHLQKIVELGKSKSLSFEDVLKIARKHKMIVADIENDVDCYIYTTYIAEDLNFYTSKEEVSLYPFKGNMELDGKIYDVSCTFLLEKNKRLENIKYIKCDRNHNQEDSLLMAERNVALLSPVKDETNFVLAHKDIEKLINIVQEIGTNFDKLEEALRFAVKMGCYIAPFNYDFIWQADVCQKEMLRLTANYKKND